MYEIVARRQISSAALWNNRGFCHMRANHFDSARECFDAALRIDPTLQTALLNRALSEFLHAVTDGRQVTEQCRVDITAAIALGPKSANLFHIGALVAARLTDDPERLNLAIQYLEQARQLGYNPDGFKKDLAFKALRPLPDFQRLVRKPPGDGGPLKAEHLLDPLDGWPDSSDLVPQIAVR